MWAYGFEIEYLVNFNNPICYGSVCKHLQETMCFIVWVSATKQQTPKHVYGTRACPRIVSLCAFSECGNYPGYVLLVPRVFTYTYDRIL